MLGAMAVALVWNGREERFDGDLVRMLADHARGRSPRLADRLDDAVARHASLEITDRDAELLVSSVDAMITPEGSFNGGLRRIRWFARRAGSPEDRTVLRPVRS
jgi:hypothetical protein